MDFEAMKQRNQGKAAVADTEPEKIMPKVIMYDPDTGVPINAQDKRAATGQEAKTTTLPWAEWLRGRIAHALCDKANHIAAIQLVLNALHTRGRIDQTPIDTIVDLNSKRKVVKASEALPKLPDARDDDIIARQLREAAMQESDPELREKLWKEFERYKNSGA